MDRGGRSQDRLHHAWQSLGEWILRELQLEATGRTSQWRDLLHSRGSQGRHRRLAAPLQHCAAALIARIQTTRSRGSAMASFAIRPSITGYADRSAKTDHELTSTPDHLMGADQFAIMQRVNSRRAACAPLLNIAISGSPKRQMACTPHTSHV